MDIHESDWRVFRRLHSIALERFCKRVLEEVRETAACETDYHEATPNKTPEDKENRETEGGDQ
jgi:hypothetical protein